MKSTVLTLALALALALAASAACLWLAGARARIALEGPRAAASFQAAGNFCVLASLKQGSQGQLFGDKGFPASEVTFRDDLVIIRFGPSDQDDLNAGGQLIILRDNLAALVVVDAAKGNQ
ncbi:MAG: hypothetical protein HY721_08015 [Planctomycetes bacterium]|nr:hypothetical protein [Planctomycetota bacterium]